MGPQQAAVGERLYQGLERLDGTRRQEGHIPCNYGCNLGGLTVPWASAVVGYHGPVPWASAMGQCCGRIPWASAVVGYPLDVLCPDLLCLEAILCLEGFRIKIRL